MNSAFDEHFENMDEYKHEINFKRCLNKLQLSNVIDAVNRAKTIMQRNQDSGYVLQQYKGYRYYKENPSLAKSMILRLKAAFTTPLRHHFERVLI